MKRIRFGVVGVGDVARCDHPPAWQRLAGRAELISVCGRTSARVASVARRFGAARPTTSVEDVVAAREIDAIINLTPIQPHVDVTLAALVAGKHVYSERPVAQPVADAERIGHKADEAAVVVVAVVRARSSHSSALQRASWPIATSPLLRACAHGFAGVPPWEAYASDPTLCFLSGSGRLYDVAVYPLDVVTVCLGVCGG